MLEGEEKYTLDTFSNPSLLHIVGIAMNKYSKINPFWFVKLVDDTLKMQGSYDALSQLNGMSMEPA